MLAGLSVERRGRETREARAAVSPVSRLRSRAGPLSCLARFARQTKKKRETPRGLVYSEQESC